MSASVDSITMAEQANKRAYADALASSTFWHVTAATAAVMTMPTARNKRNARTVYGMYASLEKALAAKASCKYIVRPSRTDAAMILFKGVIVEVRPDGSATVVA